MQLSIAGIQTASTHEKKASQRTLGVSRKDTIIIAMLVNIALLAVLFATANRPMQNVAVTKVEPVLAHFETISQGEKPAPIQVKAPVDEIDELLRSYAQKAQNIAPVEAKQAQEPAKKPISSSHIEITVKKGDVLSRIARKYNVKVEEIIILNSLESPNVKVGQRLLIPQAKGAVDPTSDSYIVQEGDSPWKIAKKCRIEVEELLRLNNLDEAKAKNLKIGQKLRIRQ